MTISFEYNKAVFCTTDYLKVTVADLRDLIQAQNIESDEQKLAELKAILKSIMRKNRLPIGIIDVQ